jgi:hypothetical protein
MEGALFYYVRPCLRLPGKREHDAECAPAPLKVRKNIDSRTAQELADFRRAIKQAPDDNGF